MRQPELVDLIERRAPISLKHSRYRNATWTLEDPVETFVTWRHTPFPAAFRTPWFGQAKTGRVQWTAMGKDAWISRRSFRNGLSSTWTHPFNRNYFWILEGIPYLQSQFWSPYSTIRADDFSRFCFFHAKAGSSSPSPLCRSRPKKSSAGLSTG